MPRHAAEQPTSSWSVRWGIVLVAMVVIGVVLTGVLVVYQLLGPNDGTAGGPDASGDGCEDAASVRIVPAPEAAPVVQAALDAALADPAVTPAEDIDRDCLDVEVEGQTPQLVLAELVEGTGRRVDVWVPDSSVWSSRATSLGVENEPLGVLGRSDVVVASTQGAVDELGWGEGPPTWAEVMTAPRPLAVPDFSESAAALLGLTAAVAEVDDQAAQGELATAAVLSQERAGVDEDQMEQEILAGVAGAGADAGVAVVGGLTLARAAERPEGDALVTVSPAGPVPFLDYPLVDLGDFERPERRPYVDFVVAALGSEPARAVLAEAGLDTGAEPRPDALPVPDQQQDTLLLTTVSALEQPSQILVVMDVSTSMSAEVEPGVTRADVAGEAALRALGLLPDTSSIGLWLFASELEGEQDWTVAAPIRRLDEPGESGSTQREQLAGVVSTLSERLRPGGTSLYDVTLAAVREARETRRENAVTTVVVITDGRNEDSTGVQLDQLVELLAEDAGDGEAVGLAMVAFGPDADLESIRTIVSSAEQSGAAVPAQAIDAREPDALAELLISTISARVRQGAADG